MPSTPSTPSTSGSAERWGPLWGARPRAWAASEELQAPTYREAIARIGVQAGSRVLDVGCGTGMFLRLVADRGAAPYGLDASDALLQLARERVPEADLRAGDMQFLPYEEDCFDLVCGFNAFFFAADMVAALREAGRVVRRGGPVLIQVWGRPERCDLEAMKAIMRPFLPAPPPNAPAATALWKPGVLEEMVVAAGMTPRSAFDLAYAFEYPDESVLGRLMLAPAGIATTLGPDREESVRAEIVEALAPYRSTQGVYRLHNEFHYLVASAP
ncbi:MAG: class I SAM-dependent methyltransferase [Solirubrobacteraceae bacterium]